MELDVFRERGDGSEAAVRDREGAVPPGPTCRSRAGRRRTTPQDSGGTVLPRGERGWSCLMTGRERASGNEIQEADVAEFWRALSGVGEGGTDTAPEICGRPGLRPPSPTLVSKADPMHTVSTYETMPFDAQPRPSLQDAAFTSITA